MASAAVVHFGMLTFFRLTTLLNQSHIYPVQLQYIVCKPVQVGYRLAVTTPFGVSLLPFADSNVR